MEVIEMPRPLTAGFKAVLHAPRREWAYTRLASFRNSSLQMLRLGDVTSTEQLRVWWFGCFMTKYPFHIIRDTVHSGSLAILEQVQVSPPLGIAKGYA